MPGTDPLRVAIILGSTREGRVCDAVGDWFAELARRHGGLETEVLDLAAYRFPERYPRRPTGQVRELLARLGRAEAFVVVTPEYNRSFPAALKQAIDFAYDEWRAKPVGFVSYGCGSDGVYAAEQLRTVFTELHAATIRARVGVNLLGGGVDAAGRPLGTDEQTRAAAALLDQLLWWGLTLRDGRAARPYVS